MAEVDEFLLTEEEREARRQQLEDIIAGKRASVTSLAEMGATKYESGILQTAAARAAAQRELESGVPFEATYARLRGLEGWRELYAQELQATRGISPSEAAWQAGLTDVAPPTAQVQRELAAREEAALIPPTAPPTLPGEAPPIEEAQASLDTMTQEEWEAKYGEFYIYPEKKEVPPAPAPAAPTPPEADIKPPFQGAMPVYDENGNIVDWIAPSLKVQRWLDQQRRQDELEKLPTADLSADELKLLVAEQVKLAVKDAKDLEEIHQKIQREGKTPETVKALEMMGATALEIDQIFDETASNHNLISSFLTLFPVFNDLDDAAIQGAFNNLELYLDAVRFKGRSPETIAFLRALDPSLNPLFRDYESRLTAFFGTKSDADYRRILQEGGVPKEEIDKIIAMSHEDLTSEEWLQRFKDINFSVGKDFFYGIASRSIASGIGNIVAAGAGLAGIAEQENIRANLMEISSVLQSSAPEMVGWEGLETIIDPRFWLTTGLSTSVYSVAALPVGLLLAAGGMAAAGAVGLGAVGTAILTVTTGAIGSGAVEAAMESGSAYNDAIAQGMTQDEATHAATSVFVKNFLLLTATSIPEFAVAFGVANPLGAVKNMAVKGLVRVTTSPVGKITSVALTEGGQEFAQDIFTRQALGQEVKWDDEAKMAVMLGATLGIGLGGGVQVVQSILTRTESRLNPEQKAAFDAEKARLMEMGIAEQSASLGAMDALAKTDSSVLDIVTDVTEQVKKGEVIEQVIRGLDPANKAEITAWQKIKAKTQEAIAEERGGLKLPKKKLKVPKVPAEEVTPAPEVTKISPQKEAIIQKTVSDLGDKGFTTQVTSVGIDKTLEKTVRGKYIGETKAIVFRSEGDITPFLAEHELLHSVVAEARRSIGDDFLARYAKAAGFTGRDLAKAIEAEYTVRTPIVEDLVRNMQVYLKHPNELSTPTKSFFDSFKAQVAIPKAVTPEVAIPKAEAITKPVTPAPEVTIPDITRKGIPIGRGLDQTFTRQLADGTFQVTPSYNLASKRFEQKVFKTQEEAKAYINELLRAIPVQKSEIGFIPAPEVTKIEPSYVNLTEGQTLVDQSGERRTITAINKKGVPARWTYTTKEEKTGFMRTRPLGEIERYEKIEQAVSIPQAEPAQTWTEAGIQPSMLPEDVASIEIRPPAKGRITQISMDDQLKLEQARKAAEEAEVAESEAQEAYEAQWEIEGLKAVHRVDPVATWSTEQIVTRRTKQPDGSYKLTQFTRKVGLDSLISIREQTFPDTLTVKQARMIWPGADYSRWLKSGTKEYNKVPLDVPLDPIASELGFTGTTAVNDLVARIEQIKKEKATLREAQRTIKRQMVERPILLEKAAEDISDLIKIRGEPLYTIEQIDALSGMVGEYLINPNTLNAYQVVRKYQALERARRFPNVASRRQDLIVREGLSWEEAHNKAMNEFARGKLPSLTLEGLLDITAELRDVFFAKVHHTFDQLGVQYEGERWGTITALTNALDGIPIPMERGKGSLLFPRGGSAWDRLNYVFNKQPRLMEGLTKTAEQKKSLKDVAEGIFREIPEGGMPPVQIDEEMAAYLRNLSLAYDQIKIGGLPTELQFQITEDMKSLPSNLSVKDTRTAVERIIEMRKKGLLPTPPVAKFEAPIEDAFKQGHLWPRPVRDNIVRALKELGMFPVDIGNFLRANKASVDFSFWRQQAPLIASHPISFAQANVEAWRALWSQKSTEASWERITRDPLYQIYEEAAATGGDFLRPVMLPKGTAQYKGTEEYGYTKGVERFLPKLAAAFPWVKLSARAFETGTNVHNWLIFKSYYAGMLRLADQYASGQKKFKVGEAFDIKKEMVDFSKSLANFSARGSLGKFAATAPELSGLFFAPRAAIGRILSVKDLINANPRVRLEAWKNAATFVGTFGGIILLGGAMGWWEVERDPRSAEYMSIRIGNTRIDPWGGFRQFLVFFTRAITKTGVSSVTGAEYEVDPINLIQTFIRGKASPLASLILDFWREKDFIGEKVDVANKAQWAERVAPFAVWDIYEAFKDDPIHGLQVVIPAILGAGVQTYTGDWKENWKKLGLPKYSENLAYGLTEPKYDTADFWADTASQFKGVDPATLTKQKGFPEYIRAIVEVRLIKEHLNSLPSEKLVSLNADPNKGLTFKDYRDMWAEREKLVAAGDDAELVVNELQPDGKYKKVTYKGQDAVDAFDRDERTRNANLGNFSQRQFALLNEYWSITDKKEQADFLDEHKAEIGTNPRQDYLKSHPVENAQLAIWGQAKLLSKAAYDEFRRLVKELDIPDSALPVATLPSEKSVENYFKYQDMESKTSLEAQLLLAKDDDLREFLGRGVIDTPIASLELKVKNRELSDQYEALKTDKERADFKTAHPEFVDDQRRIEAIENEADDETIKKWVERGQTADKVGAGSAEAKVWLLDNPEVHTWALNNGLLIDDGSDWNVPVLRLNVKWVKEDGEYAALTNIQARQEYLASHPEYNDARRERAIYNKDQNVSPNVVSEFVEYGRLIDEFGANSAEATLYRMEHPDLQVFGQSPETFSWDDLVGVNVPKLRLDVKLREQDKEFDALRTAQAREDYLKENTEYRQDRLRRQAYEKDIPSEHIENFVQYSELPVAGYRQERFLVEHPGLAKAMGILDPDPSKIPSVKYDELLEKENKTPDDLLRMDAYLALFADEQVEDYVGYHTILRQGRPKGQDFWFDDDWFLMEHSQFYAEAKKRLGWKEKDFSQVPTRRVFGLYQQYDNLATTGKDRLIFRHNHPDLEKWMVDVLGYAPVGDRWKTAPVKRDVAKVKLPAELLPESKKPSKKPNAESKKGELTPEWKQRLADMEARLAKEEARLAGVK